MTTEILGVSEAAKELKVSMRRVQAMIKSKKLKAFKLGHQYVIHREDLNAEIIRRFKREFNNENIAILDDGMDEAMKEAIILYRAINT